MIYCTAVLLVDHDVSDCGLICYVYLLTAWSAANRATSTTKPSIVHALQQVKCSEEYLCRYSRS